MELGGQTANQSKMKGGSDDTRHDSNDRYQASAFFILFKNNITDGCFCCCYFLFCLKKSRCFQGVFFFFSLVDVKKYSRLCKEFSFLSRRLRILRHLKKKQTLVYSHGKLANKCPTQRIERCFQCIRFRFLSIFNKKKKKKPFWI